VPNPVLTTGNQGYETAYSYQQPTYTTTYAGGVAPKETLYTNYPAAVGSEVRNTYNYAQTGAANVASTVRNTVVGETIAAPPKITFGHPSGGYVQQQTNT
jgi:hypothetical protein